MPFRTGNRMNITEQAHMTELIQLISESNNNELRELFGMERLGRGAAAMDSENAESRAIAEANREYRKRFEAGKR